MAWICVGCSEQHEDRLDTMGFGLCKVCSDTAKRKRADEKAARFAARVKNNRKIKANRK